jgi:hypothetical protein
MPLAAADEACSTRWLVPCVLTLLLCARVTHAQSDEALDTDSAQSTPSPETQPAVKLATASTLRLLLQAGVGATQRTIDVPSAQGRTTLRAGFVPALDMRASGRLMFEHFFVRIRAGYQTSLGVHAADRLQIVTPGQASTAVRSHRLEGGIAPGLWLGTGPGSAALSLYIAYGLRAFSSVSPLLIPRFTLHGPLLRVELEVPLIGKLIWLQIAPEAQFILSITQDLRGAGGLYARGIAYGAEAGLYVRLGAWAGVRLNYRESHAYVAAAASAHANFADVERYVVLDGMFSY